jgi:hypothetical protein
MECRAAFADATALGNAQRTPRLRRTLLDAIQFILFCISGNGKGSRQEFSFVQW